ncbi:MAG: YceI family protein [Woeseia sp.]
MYRTFRLTWIVGVAALLMSPLYAAEPDAAPAAGRYSIDTAASELRVLVYRGGLLGGLGHNHVVSSNAINGFIDVSKATADSRVHLELLKQSLVVDDPALRKAEGEKFANTVSTDDIAATRRNMLGPDLLDASRSDEIRVDATRVTGEYPDLEITADVSVLGVARELTFPVTVRMTDNKLRATGELAVTHKELGLRPFTAAMGTLRVRNELTFRYEIVAVRADDQSSSSPD